MTLSTLLRKIHPPATQSDAWIQSVSPATLEAMLGASEDAFFTKDLNGRYLSINGSGAKMLGRAPSAILGRSDAEFFSPTTARKIFARDQAIMASGVVHAYEDTGTLDALANDARPVRWYRSSKGPTYDSNGVMVGLWGISRDVTDERNARLEREQLHVNLSASVKELTTVEGKLAQSERLATLGRLAAVLAHEIRNPLAVILNATSLARRSTAASREESVFDIITEEVGRLNGLVTDLLDFARFPSPVFAYRELGALVRDVLDRALCAHPSKALQLDLVGLANPALAMVDERLLERALVNVVENACQAMNGEGVLTIGLMVAQGMTHIRVTDTGCGMSDVARANLFKPFCTTKATGTGLGLFVAKRVLEEHDGHVTVVTNARGTSVTLSLPALRPSRAETIASSSELPRVG